MSVAIGAGRFAVGFLALFFALTPLAAQHVSVSVFGLFLPQELIAAPVPGGRLNLLAGGEPLTLEGGRKARLSRRGPSVGLAGAGMDSLAELVTATPSVPAGRFLLEVPGKIRREFAGKLRVRVRGESLEAVVEMDLESAVAAIVAAEGGDGPPEALAALAVAVRSYLTAAAGRHSGYQFCDTTHCQYLAAPPSAASAAFRAAARTRGLVLSYRGARFAPLYSRSCGGTTRTSADVGFSGGAFPYRRVRCLGCSREPASWTANRPARELSAILFKPGDENARLEVVRKLGWGAVPSNRYEIGRDGDHVLLEGAGEGHGVGLCQRGAIGLASDGWPFREILGRYFPDASIVEFTGK